MYYIVWLNVPNYTIIQSNWNQFKPGHISYLSGCCFYSVNDTNLLLISESSFFEKYIVKKPY